MMHLCLVPTHIIICCILKYTYSCIILRSAFRLVWLFKELLNPIWLRRKEWLLKKIRLASVVGPGTQAWVALEQWREMGGNPAYFSYYCSSSSASPPLPIDSLEENHTSPPISSVCGQCEKQDFRRWTFVGSIWRFRWTFFNIGEWEAEGGFRAAAGHWATPPQPTHAAVSTWQPRGMG